MLDIRSNGNRISREINIHVYYICLLYILKIN